MAQALESCKYYSILYLWLYTQKKFEINPRNKQLLKSLPLAFWNREPNFGPNYFYEIRKLPKLLCIK